MAVWDRRDPRWHVEDRPDGSNVNGWHWEERNRVSWSQQRLQELLGSGLPPAQLDAALGSAEITSLKSCTGEAYQTLRKGNKTFSVYDLTITLEWTGCWKETDSKVKGDIVITEFSSVNDPDEYEITVNASDGDAAAVQNLKAAISGLQPAILERLAQYVADLNALAIQ